MFETFSQILLQKTQLLRGQKNIPRCLKISFDEKYLKVILSVQGYGNEVFMYDRNAFLIQCYA